MINIDYKDRRPIYVQLVEGIESLIAKGVLLPDTQLPSVRSLALELAINPNTISKAYQELEKRSTVYTVSGRGTFISKNQANLREQFMEKMRLNINDLIAEAADYGITTDEFIQECSEILKIKGVK